MRARNVDGLLLDDITPISVTRRVRASAFVSNKHREVMLCSRRSTIASVS